MNSQIKSSHLEKLAFVYLRQSSPTQVKNNVESGRRQRQMQERVGQLGWPSSSIHVLGGDTGRSGSTLHGRDDYQVMLEAVLAGNAGLIAARELSRLVRDNQDWNQLVRVCRHQHVLLLDEQRIYDATNAQDRVVLGVAGAFNEFEIAMIIDRMLESQRQKAARGELYEGRFSPGYVCRKQPLCEKHPDPRVQRAVMRVFDHFDRCVSVVQLHRELMGEKFQLPVVPAGCDWRDIHWVAPTYDQLLDMLKHPIYAGIYVRGRKKTFTVLNPAGHVQKQRRRVARGQWQVFLEDHHEPYIVKDRWERNVEKIASNARGGGAMKGTPQESPALLAGLLRCHRCGNRFHTQYPSGGVYYRCRGGARQREVAKQSCFGFPGSPVEERVSELIREAVRPAAIAAAVQAAERLSAEYEQRRQLIVDRVITCREVEARAAREYKATDSTCGAVRQRLASEWEQAIAAVEAEQSRLAAFDREVPVLPTGEQRQQLDHLSEELHRVWFHPQVSMVLKKQVVRTLIEEIVVDLHAERDELTLWIHWTGGHHTELHEPRHRRKVRRRNTDVKQIVEVLRKVLGDASIANVLNREKVSTSAIATWTAQRVSDFRQRHGIAAFSNKKKQQQGWLTGAEAANSLGISAMSVTRLIQAGVLPAEQPLPGLPAVISRGNLSDAAEEQDPDEARTDRDEEQEEFGLVFLSVMKVLEFLPAIMFLGLGIPLLVWSLWDTVVPTVMLGLAGCVAIYFVVRRIRRYRSRDCPECRMPMELLSEDDDDAHLSKSEILEEKLNSANYDVWMCSSCRRSQTVRYGAFFSRYSKCPACGAKTKSVSTAVISEPTNAMSGKKEITESCDNCDYKKQYRRSIPSTGS